MSRKNISKPRCEERPHAHTPIEVRLTSLPQNKAAPHKHTQKTKLSQFDETVHSNIVFIIGHSLDYARYVVARLGQRFCFFGLLVVDYLLRREFDNFLGENRSGAAQ